MTTIQKKTHQILSKQKQEYSQMVKAAFKGKSNLSQKQVQSTIKKVAQEYREKYGATPRKRYLSAVKEASAQKPAAKPAKQVKPKTAKKPDVKKPKYKIPDYAQGEKYGEFVKHLHVITDGLLDMAKAAGRNNVKVNVLLEECYNMKGRKKHTAEDWKRLGYIPKRGEYEYMFWADDTKRDEVIFLFTDEQVKPIKEPKPDYPNGTILVRNSDGQVVEIVRSQLIIGEWDYTIKEYMGSKMVSVRDRNGYIKSSFKRISRREAHKAWKKYKQKTDRVNAIKLSKEDEKKRKQEFRELTTINKTWIEKLAKSSNLSPNVITALYRVCAKDEIRPVMNGIYCDPEGKLVATNAHILVAIDAKVPASMQGKVFAPSGKEIEGKYPKYKKLLLHREGNRFVANATWENIGRHYVNEKFNPSDTHKYNDAQCFSIKGTVLKVDLYRIIHKVFFNLKETPVCYRVEDQNLKHYPVCFIGNAISAVQMPMCQND